MKTLSTVCAILILAAAMVWGAGNGLAPRHEKIRQSELKRSGETPPERRTGTGHRPVPILQISEGSNSGEPLTMTKIKTDVTVHGYLAETRVTMTFGNHLDRPVAGDLVFPLPDGAAVSGYALDVGGTMVDGVAVEREKARTVFEQEVRKGIDPGIIEKLAGNNYRTRVFPIPAKGSRTIMVRYLSRLATAPEGAIYDLPLDFSKPVEELSLRIEVVKPSSPPKVEESGLANFAFARWRDSYVAEMTLHNALPEHGLKIVLPGTVHNDAMIEKSSGGERYFIAGDQPPLMKMMARNPDYRKIAILWDASGSHEQADHEREFELLRKLFARNSSTLREVELTLFRDAAEPPRRITIKNGSAEELIKLLKNVDYDGGTQLGSLDRIIRSKETDLFLLFSDGLQNFGDTLSTRPAALLCTISSDSRANHSLLRQLAGESGGSYLNLSTMSANEAAAAIGAPILRLMDVRFTPGEVEMVYPPPGSELSRDMLLVSGRLLTKQAEITLVYGANGREITRKSIRLSAAEASEGHLAETFWAMQRLEALSMAPVKNRSEIIALGKQYGLATAETSLIVLENLGQYLQHRIAPPASLPLMRQQYDETVQHEIKTKGEARRAKIDRVAQWWQNRVTWWHKEFKYPKNFNYQQQAVSKSEAMGSAVMSEQSMDRREMRRDSIAEDRVNSPLPASAPALAQAPARVAALKKSKKDGTASDSDNSSVAASIAITPWDPQTPYLAAIKGVRAEQRYHVYMEQKKAFGRSPGFYFDCAGFFINAGERGVGVRILSNLSEMELENPVLMRILGYRLAQMDELNPAITLFEEVLTMRPEEAQSHRDLALLLARRGENRAKSGGNAATASAAKDLERAIQLLNTVIEREWNRSDEIELVALMELNRYLPLAKKVGAKLPDIDPRLVKALDLDLRIVLTWDMDMTDLDLWITEPSHEKGMYSHPDTVIGGHLSRDVTGGYGPEEYVLHRAMPGEYAIEANYFGTRNPGLAGAATLQVELFTNYGRPDERRQVIVKRLDSVREVIKIGTATVGK